MLKRLIKNVRQGLATNSSSSHSLVYTESEHSREIHPGESYDTDYGWGHFVASSLGEKLMYKLTDMVGQNYWNRDPSEDEVAEMQQQYGHLFPELDESHFKAAMRGYVDHQSRGEISLEEARDPKTEIHGGNDNDGPTCADCATDDDYWYR